MLNFFKQYVAEQWLNPKVELFQKLISTELDKFLIDLPYLCIEYLNEEKQRETTLHCFLTKRSRTVYQFPSDDTHIRSAFLSTPLN